MVPHLSQHQGSSSFGLGLRFLFLESVFLVPKLLLFAFDESSLQVSASSLPLSSLESISRRFACAFGL